LRAGARVHLVDVEGKTAGRYENVFLSLSEGHLQFIF